MVFIILGYTPNNSAPIYAFLEFFVLVSRTISFPGHWVLSHTADVVTMSTGERGTNTLCMSVLNPRERNLLSRSFKPGTLVSSPN